MTTGINRARSRVAQHLRGNGEAAIVRRPTREDNGRGGYKDTTVEVYSGPASKVLRGNQPFEALYAGRVDGRVDLWGVFPFGTALAIQDIVEFPDEDGIYHIIGPPESGSLSAGLVVALRRVMQ